MPGNVMYFAVAFDDQSSSCSDGVLNGQETGMVWHVVILSNVKRISLW
jgi:hypothetical protein